MDAGVIVSSLPEPERHAFWPDVERILKPALTDDQEVFDPAIDTAWVAYSGEVIFGAATTRLRTDGIAELRLAGGARHREWVGPLDEAVTAWARLCGAHRLTMRGRKGWARYARAFGWAATDPDDEGKLVFEKVL